MPGPHPGAGSIRQRTCFPTGDRATRHPDVSRSTSASPRPDSASALWVIIHEAALHQRFVVLPATMREQLRRLLDTAEMPNVT